MEIQVSKLREALALLELVAPKKPKTLPVLANVQLGDGRAVATNLEMAVSVSLPEAQEPMLLPLVQAMLFLTYAPGYLLARVSQENGRVNIAVGNMETSLIAEGKRDDDYPPIPQVKADGEGVLDGDALVKALEAVLPYAATEDTRPVLEGICLTLGEKVEVAGADGFRLAWETVPGKLGTEGKLIIPPNTVKVLGQLWKKGATPDMGSAADPASIALAKRLIRFGWQTSKALMEMRFGGITITTQLIQGTFPHYEQLVPTDTSLSVTFYGEDIIPALEQVKGLAKNTSGIVRLAWESDRLKVSARAEDVGETTVAIPARSSTPGQTAVNIGYLLKYFPGKGEVTMSTASPQSPILFTHRGTPHVVMMPMFVQWGKASKGGQEDVVAEAEKVAQEAQEAVGGETPPDDESMYEQPPDEAVDGLSEPPPEAPEAETTWPEGAFTTETPQDAKPKRKRKTKAQVTE